VEAAADMSDLVVLRVSNNPLLQLPAALGRGQPKLAAVHASQCRLTCVPPGLAHARWLRTLQLSGNRLRDLDSHVLKGMCVGLS
jgi:Leucine-rich repeat (LRR) protein